MLSDQIQEYIDIFNEEKNIPVNAYEPRTVVLNLDRDGIEEFLAKYANTLNVQKTEENVHAIALIMYVYRAGIIETKNTMEVMTRQSGFVNTPLWSTGRAIDEMLNKDITDGDEEEESDEAISVSNLIEWIVNPAGNVEIWDGILGKMILPMVKELGKNVPPGKNPNYTVIVPPVSDQLSFPDWQKLFSNIKTNYAKVRIVDYRELLNIGKNERVYFCISQTDGEREYLIISAYEVIRGRKACVGSIAFDVTNNEQYDMENVHEVKFEINNSRKDVGRKEKGLIEIKSDWDYVPMKCPLISGFKSFLGSVSPTFLNEMYAVTGKYWQKDGAAALYNGFVGTEALRVSEICSRLLKEKNLNKISLGDMVYVADLLDKDRAFGTVLIRQNRDKTLGTLSDLGKEIDFSRMAEIPANYANFTWKVKSKVQSFAPYFDLDKKQHTLKQIIESTIDHYSHCSTAQVAEDIMYLYNDNEPNAYFTAKVFMILSAMDTLLIDSKDEIIDSITNVDSVDFVAVDEKEKAAIRRQTLPVKKASKPKTTIFKSDQKTKTRRAISIEKAQFSTRTYNCLRRAGIKTLGELVNKSPVQLLKIRNLGQRGVDEILSKLRTYGIGGY
ncbi:RNA polymerase, alpha chain C terminal domain [Butyrivibrio sp. YAB3001]|nr:RNA polymerase, alpha chain C terminal domain [Butyrivibrio sp. YAB3001]